MASGIRHHRDRAAGPLGFGGGISLLLGNYVARAEILSTAMTLLAGRRGRKGSPERHSGFPDSGNTGPAEPVALPRPGITPGSSNRPGGNRPGSTGPGVRNRPGVTAGVTGGSNGRAA